MRLDDARSLRAQTVLLMEAISVKSANVFNFFYEFMTAENQPEACLSTASDTGFVIDATLSHRPDRLISTLERFKAQHLFEDQSTIIYRFEIEDPTLEHRPTWSVLYTIETLQNGLVRVSAVGRIR